MYYKQNLMILIYAVFYLKFIFFKSVEVVILFHGLITPNVVIIKTHEVTVELTKRRQPCAFLLQVRRITHFCHLKMTAYIITRSVQSETKNLNFTLKNI